MQLGQYFIIAIFSPNFVSYGNEHIVEEFMPSKCFDVLQQEVNKKYGTDVSLHNMQNEWDLDRLHLEVGGSISKANDEEEEYVTLHFKVNKKGQLGNITMSR